MAKQLIECVPNFSEGVEMSVIKQITNEIKSVEGVSLLDVDPGKATNRTVVTFVGEPLQVVDAAFKAIRKASELINMRNHTGEHPRMGATDVCPFVPVANITMKETVKYANLLAARVGLELDIPVFLYEHAASKPERRNLSFIREGEYEGMETKLKQDRWKPDHGKAFNPTAGVTAIGARDFLIAYNINLNTKSVRKANSVAFDLREQGRIKRKGHPATGKILKNKKGEPLRIKGSLKSVKGIGWYIEEYGIAQISMNLTNINITSLHKAFDESVKKATARGLRVTGSELVGLVPLQSMLDAGAFFLRKQGASAGVSEEDLIQAAVKSMGLDELKPFNPDKKIIEYLIRDKTGALVDLNLRAFANETASDSPAPGGGSISAYIGALGASLGTMVANLSAVKRGWEKKTDKFSKLAVEGQAIKDTLLALVDADTDAFNQILDASRMAKGSKEEKLIREESIQTATKNAIEVPIRVMQESYRAMDLLNTMAEIGNPNSASDAGVGALCARTAVIGAYLNVKINMPGITDKNYKKKTLAKAERIMGQAIRKENAILNKVKRIIGR